MVGFGGMGRGAMMEKTGATGNYVQVMGSGGSGGSGGWGGGGLWGGGIGWWDLVGGDRWGLNCGGVM